MKEKRQIQKQQDRSYAYTNSIKFRKHKSEWKNCIICEMGKECFKHVFYRGLIPCDVLFIGEAPGEVEDTLGVPFKGDAGRILQKIINETSEFLRESENWEKDFSYGITNIVACRPRDKEGKNRIPTPKEIASCKARLVEMIKLACPRLIILLGKTAQDNCPHVVNCQYCNLVHPAYILRMGSTERGQREQRITYKKTVIDLKDAIERSLV